MPGKSAYLRQAGLLRAVLGDGNGNVYSSRNYVYARLLDGEAADGSLAMGTTIEVLPGGGVKPQNNRRVWLIGVPGNTGMWRVASADYDEAAFSTNPLPSALVDKTSQPARIYLRNIQDGITFPALDANGAYTKKLVSERGILYVAPNGTLQSQTIPASAPLDLTDAFTSTQNTMRDVLTYHDPILNTNGYVENDTATLDEGRLTRTQTQTLIDKLPHQYVKRRQVYRLKWYQTVVTQSNMMLDLRAFENEPMMTGVPKRIKRNMIILADEQWIIEGEQTCDFGRHLIHGWGSQRIVRFK